VIEQACRHACVEYRTDLPPGVEAVKRGDHLFLISHLDRPVELDLGGKSLDLLMSAIVGPAVVLEPRGVMVLNARDLQKLKVCGLGRSRATRKVVRAG
jgi:hypothetical protein